MAWNREVAREVSVQLDRRRQRAMREAADRKREALETVPGLRQVEQELGELGARIAREALLAADPEQKILELKTKAEAMREKKRALLNASSLREEELLPKFSCPLCEDTGYVEGRRCQCFERLYKKELAGRSNLGKAMERQRFDNFDLSYYPQIQEPGRPCAARENMERVKSYCMEFARHFESAERSLLMIGGSGLGKTHLSSAIAGELLEQGYSVIYETAGDIFAAFEAEKFSRPIPGRYTTQEYLECDLLILDDLGAEFNTPFCAAALFQLINSRGNQGRRMLVNTNLTLKELSDRYPPRIVSRILGEFTICHFWGEDIRLQLRRK